MEMEIQGWNTKGLLALQSAVQKHGKTEWEKVVELVKAKVNESQTLGSEVQAGSLSLSECEKVHSRLLLSLPSLSPLLSHSHSSLSLDYTSNYPLPASLSNSTLLNSTFDSLTSINNN